MERNKVLLLLLGLAIVGYFFYSGGIGLGETKNKISCIVNVKNPATNDVFQIIEPINCQVVGECFGGFFAIGENVASVLLFKMIISALRNVK